MILQILATRSGGIFVENRNHLIYAIVFDFMVSLTLNFFSKARSWFIFDLMLSYSLTLVFMQGICNQFIDIKISVGCMVWLTNSKNIDKMRMFFIKPFNTNFWNTSRQWQEGINIVHHVPQQERYVKFSFLWNWLTQLTNQLKKP